jgi:nucleotide-binding universal stress UspA family protein
LLENSLKMTFKHILVATDFGEPAERALDLAVELARTFDARLTLVHSWEAPSYSYGGALYVPADFITPIEEAAHKHLAGALTELQRRVPNAQAVLRAGAAWQEVLAAAQESHADLIVLGTHGRRGLNRALLGSVAEKIVRLSEVPVLTVHGKEEQK